MNDWANFLITLLIGFVMGSGVFKSCAMPGYEQDAYTKGITDCQQGTTSYTVTVGPEGVDTTYVYKP